jgi:hypothetical protein
MSAGLKHCLLLKTSLQVQHSIPRPHTLHSKHTLLFFSLLSLYKKTVPRTTAMPTPKFSLIPTTAPELDVVDCPPLSTPFIDAVAAALEPSEEIDVIGPETVVLSLFMLAEPVLDDNEEAETVAAEEVRP